MGLFTTSCLRGKVRVWMGNGKLRVGQVELEVPPAQAPVTVSTQMPPGPLELTVLRTEATFSPCSQMLVSVGGALMSPPPPISQARRNSQRHPWLIPLPLPSPCCSLFLSPSPRRQAKIKITVHFTVLLIVMASFCLGEYLKVSKSVWNPYFKSSY